MTEPQKACQRPGCTNFLLARQKKYCSNACKATAMHSKRRQVVESVALDEVRARVGTMIDREGLTERVLQEVKVLTELLPEAVRALQRNLDDEDPQVRQRASDTILRYTVGNSAIAPEETKQAPVAINFGIPLQYDKAVTELEGPESGSVLGTAEPDEVPVRTCAECGEEKLATQFVGESERCQSCHQAMLDDVRAKFPGMLGSEHAR